MFWLSFSFFNKMRGCLFYAPFSPEPLLEGGESIEIKAVARLSRFYLYFLSAARMRVRSLLSMSLGVFKDIATIPLELGAFHFNTIVIFLCVFYGLIWHGIIGASLFVLISQSWLWFIMLKEHIRKQRIKKTEGWETSKEESEEALTYLAKAKKI